jgi:hypothetical protein
VAARRRRQLLGLGPIEIERDLEEELGLDVRHLDGRSRRV